ncbi:MAG: ferrous iron transport protein B [Phascolarctobacterium sp.]|nr:ferrous iron transport protein B [Phascolarctobacterium sp.]
MKETIIALVGNQNCGKTTLFNDLTGANQYVGNWPGVTVEKKEGHLKGSDNVKIADLPGIYSLSPYSPEEIISRNYALGEDVDSILNLVDASNIERNLYLTTQVMEMGKPVAIALNMMDIVKSRGDKIDVKRLSQLLGCEIIETCGIDGKGVKEAAQAAVKAVGGDVSKQAVIKFAAPVEKAIQGIDELLGAKLPKQTKRWYLVKLFERDKKVLEGLALSSEENKKLNAIVNACEDKLGDDAESIISNERYNFIEAIIKDAVVKNDSVNTISDKIDKLVTSRIFALPIFLGVMFLVYYIAMDSIGADMTDWVNDVLFGEIIQPGVQEWMEGAGCEEWLTSLVVDGIIAGVGAPLGFAPQMAVLFFMLSFLEDCGYMSRIAFIMDKIFRFFGLSGKSFIPLIVSSGCGVPGIMATRTIENERDRRMTIMTTTFIPCGAKLPVIALFSGVIMGGEGWMATAMYFIGIASVILACLILKKCAMFAGDPAPFVMELPPYHMPTLKNLFMHTWERVSDFLKKAGTIIFVCCAAMWFLSSFGFEEGALAMVEDNANSFIGVIGGAIAPIFAPLGFDTWQAVAASITGFVAKEGIVSTIAIVSGLEEPEEVEEAKELFDATRALFPSVSAAFSFLVFNLMDSPCFAAIAAINREMNSKKWTFRAIAFQNIYAYLLCTVIYQFGRVFVEGEAFNAMTGVAAVIVVFAIYLVLRPASEPMELKAKSTAVVKN